MDMVSIYSLHNNNVHISLLWMCYLLQMHHPIQMKPADSEKNNGKDLLAFSSVFFFCALILADNSVHFLSNGKDNPNKAYCFELS